MEIKSTYYIAVIDDISGPRIGAGHSDYNELIDLVLIAYPAYEKKNKEVFICEVWV